MQKNVFVIGRILRHKACTQFSRKGMWIANSQNENPARYFAAANAFSFETMTAENFKRTRQDAATMNQYAHEYSP